MTIVDRKYRNSHFDNDYLENSVSLNLSNNYNN